VALPSYREQFLAQLLPGTAPGLDFVAVGAQRDHLLGVIRAAQGEVLDVVDFQDRVPGIGDVLWLTGAVRTLAVAPAAQEDGAPRRSETQDVNGCPWLAEPRAAVAGTADDPAQAAGAARRATRPARRSSGRIPRGSPGSRDGSAGVRRWPLHR